MVLFSLFEQRTKLVFALTLTYLPALSSSMPFRGDDDEKGSLVGLLVPSPLCRDRVQETTHLLDFFLLCLLYSSSSTISREALGISVGRVPCKSMDE
jgi:hypothetical protein